MNFPSNQASNSWFWIFSHIDLLAQGLGEVFEVVPVDDEVIAGVAVAGPVRTAKPAVQLCEGHFITVRIVAPRLSAGKKSNANGSVTTAVFASSTFPRNVKSIRCYWAFKHAGS